VRDGRPLWCVAMNDPFSQWRARRKKLEAQARRILGVKEGACLEDLKKAYREQARITHPDTNPDDTQSHEKFINVKAAFLVLAKGKEEELADAPEMAEMIEEMSQEEYMSWWVRKWG